MSTVKYPFSGSTGPHQGSHSSYTFTRRQGKLSPVVLGLYRSRGKCRNVRVSNRAVHNRGPNGNTGLGKKHGELVRSIATSSWQTPSRRAESSHFSLCFATLVLASRVLAPHYLWGCGKMSTVSDCPAQFKNSYMSGARIIEADLKGLL